MKQIERFCFHLSRTVLLSPLKNDFAFTSQEQFCFHLSRTILLSPLKNGFAFTPQSWKCLLVKEKVSLRKEAYRMLSALTFLDFLMGEDRKL